MRERNNITSNRKNIKNCYKRQLKIVSARKKGKMFLVKYVGFEDILVKGGIKKLLDTFAATLTHMWYEEWLFNLFAFNAFNVF